MEVVKYSHAKANNMEHSEWQPVRTQHNTATATDMKRLSHIQPRKRNKEEGGVAAMGVTTVETTSTRGRRCW